MSELQIDFGKALAPTEKREPAIVRETTPKGQERAFTMNDHGQRIWLPNPRQELPAERGMKVEDVLDAYKDCRLREAAERQPKVKWSGKVSPALMAKQSETPTIEPAVEELAVIEPAIATLRTQKQPVLFPLLITMLAVVLGGGLLIGGFLLVPDSWFSDPTPEVIDDNPFEELSPGAAASSQFIRDYKRGMGALYLECANRARAGKFEDIVDARDFIKANKDKLRNDAFEPVKAILADINGDRWTDEDAANLFTELSDGFAK